MGRVFKKKNPSKDPLTGEMTTRESDKYYVEFIDENGKKRRKAVSPDKSIANRVLAQCERDVDRKRNGEFDPYEEHRRRPILEHVKDYEKYLRSKGNSELHVNQVIKRATDVMVNCKFVKIADLRPAAVQNFIHDLRKSGRSPQTCNFYLQAAKQFVRWLVQDRRLLDNPMRSLSPLNVRIDRRHDRRPLSLEEFNRLLSAAEAGKHIEGISGPERSILYLFASSTGLRRAELGSLTLRSLNLDGEFPSVQVQAAYSKNGRDDNLPLHPMVVEELRNWLPTQKRVSPSQPLFHLKSASGELRDTAKMMRRDLDVARKKWIEESDDPEEQNRRRESDFLRYKDSAGLFADFHANRHTFISNLAKADVHPKMAQTLARHSTINLTMNTYTHVNMEEKSLAVGRLHATSSATPTKVAVDHKVRDSDIHVKEVSVLGPSGVRNGVTIEAQIGAEQAPSGTSMAQPTAHEQSNNENLNTIANSSLGVVRHPVAPIGIDAERCPGILHPAGLEPATFGSVVYVGIGRRLVETLNAGRTLRRNKHFCKPSHLIANNSI